MLIKESQYRAYLEEFLTSEIRKQQPLVSRVSVSFDGEFAIYNIADRYTLRKLSPAAKQFLQTGDPECIKQQSLLVA